MRRPIRGVSTPEEWDRYEDLEEGKKRLTLEEFRAAVRLEAFRQVRLRAQGFKFEVVGVGRNGKEMAMAKARGRGVRHFRAPSSALVMLAEMGVKEAVVELSNWSPRGKSMFGVERPDMSARLSMGHALLLKPAREALVALVKTMRTKGLPIPAEVLKAVAEFQME